LGLPDVSFWSKSGIARIVMSAADGTDELHVAMASVIDARHVMTCCHVLNDSLRRRDRLDPESPRTGERFSIVFPDAGEAKVAVRIVNGGLDLQPPRDIAVLELDDDDPIKVGVAVFKKPRFNEKSGTALAGMTWTWNAGPRRTLNCIGERRATAEWPNWNCQWGTGLV